MIPPSEPLFDLRYHDRYPGEMVREDEEGPDITGAYITRCSTFHAPPDHGDQFRLHFNGIDYEASIELKSLFKKGLLRRRGPLQAQEATLVLTPVSGDEPRFSPHDTRLPDEPEIYLRTGIDMINEALEDKLQSDSLKKERTASTRLQYGRKNVAMTISLLHNSQERETDAPQSIRKIQGHMRRPYHPPPLPKRQKEMVHPFAAFGEILEQLKMIEAAYKDNDNLLAGDDSALPSDKHRAALGRNIEPRRLVILKEDVVALAEDIFPETKQLPEQHVYEDYHLFQQRLESLLRKNLPALSDKDRGELQYAIVNVMKLSFRKDNVVTSLDHINFKSQLERVLGLGRDISPP